MTKPNNKAFDSAWDDFPEVSGEINKKVKAVAEEWFGNGWKAAIQHVERLLDDSVEDVARALARNFPDWDTRMHDCHKPQFRDNAKAAIETLKRRIREES